MNNNYWDDISLPDEDLAWDDMRSRLEEKKRRRGFFWIFLNPALVGGFLAVAATTGVAVWVLSRQDAPKNSVSQIPPVHASPVLPHPTASSDGGVRSANVNAAVNAVQPEDLHVFHYFNSYQTASGSSQPTRRAASFNKLNSNTQAAASTINPPSTNQPQDDHSITVPVTQDSLKINTKQVDSIATPKPDSTKAIVINPEKKKHLHFSAGLGATQQISVKGQEQVRYNTAGRQNVLSDYTPSLFFRLQKDNKWYVMLEARYAAPQAVKSFSFAQSSTGNPGNYHLTVFNNVLRKTYYHQIPLSFNYFVAPNLSVGAGGVFQQFHAAVWEEQSVETDVLNGLSVRNSNVRVTKGYRDSFLYKTQLQSLVQINYDWNRWNLGLRYTYDLQPYIRFTKPDGSLVEEKNTGLYFQLRYKLFGK